MSANLTTCLALPETQLLLQRTALSASVSTAQRVFYVLGPTGIITGCAIPIIAYNLLICAKRLLHLHPTPARVCAGPRAYALLCGFLALACTSGALVKILVVYDNRTKIGIGVGVWGYVGALVALNIAGTLRFAVPLAQWWQKRVLYTATAVVVTVLAAGTVVLVGLELTAYEGPLADFQFSLNMSLINIFLPAYYGISGLVCFSYELYKTREPSSFLSTHTSRLKSLEFANHILMLTNLFLILAYFACLHAVKNDRRFESTGAMIFATCWLAIENGFENVSEVVFEGTKAAGRDVVGDPGVVGGGVRFVLPAGMETDMRAVQGDGSADEGGDDGDAGGRRGSTGTTLVTGGVKASASVTSPSPSFSDRFELADMPHRRMSGVNHNQTNTKNGTTPTYAPPRRPSTSPLTTMSGPEQSPKVPASSRRSRRPGAGLDGVDGRGDDGESGL